MMKALSGRALCVLAVIVGSAALGACSQDLFSGPDDRTAQRLRYYDNDSALKTTQDRKASAGVPFGMPTGNAEQ